MFASSIHCRWWKTHSSPYSPPSPDTCPPFSIFFYFIFFLKWYIRCYSLIILWLPSSSSLYTTGLLCVVRRDIERETDFFPLFHPSISSFCWLANRQHHRSSYHVTIWSTVPPDPRLKRWKSGGHTNRREGSQEVLLLYRRTMKRWWHSQLYSVYSPV